MELKSDAMSTDLAHYRITVCKRMVMHSLTHIA